GFHVNRFFRQRTVDEWLLFAAGRLDDVVTDIAEKEIDLQSGRFEVTQQGCREWAVSVVAVRGCRAVARREQDEHAPAGLYRREPARDRTHSRGALHLRRERIVTAGVKNDQTQLR